MHGHDLSVSAAENYRAFARDARGRSPAYEALAMSVAGDTAVYHSAVLAYVTPANRQRFAAAVRSLPAVWLSSEGPAILPGITVPAFEGGPSVLVRDGRTPLGLADGHGTWLHWLPPGTPRARGVPGGHLEKHGDEGACDERGDPIACGARPETIRTWRPALRRCRRPSLAGWCRPAGRAGAPGRGSAGG